MTPLRAAKANFKQESKMRKKTNSVEMSLRIQVLEIAARTYHGQAAAKIIDAADEMMKFMKGQPRATRWGEMQGKRRVS